MAQASLRDSTAAAGVAQRELEKPVDRERAEEVHLVAHLARRRVARLEQIPAALDVSPACGDEGGEPDRRQSEERDLLRQPGCPVRELGRTVQVSRERLDHAEPVGAPRLHARVADVLRPLEDLLVALP